MVAQINVTEINPSIVTLINLKMYDSVTHCKSAVLNADCTLPAHCTLHSRHILNIHNEKVHTCYGLNYEHDPNMIFRMYAYPLDIYKTIPKEIYYVKFLTLSSEFHHLVFLPLASLNQLSIRPTVRAEFYVSTDLRVCMKRYHQNSLDKLLQRQLTIGRGLYDQNTFAARDLPFHLETKFKYTCSLEKHPWSTRYNPRTCRATLPLNSTHAVCSHVWVRYPVPASCPNDYEYRKSNYRPEDLCVDIVKPTVKPTNTEGGGWLHNSLESVVLWMLTLAENVSQFVVLVLHKILEVVWVWCTSQKMCPPPVKSIRW